MHGGCSSVGCFAMTNQVIGEIYGLAKAAIKGGQRYVPMHVLPFRMTEQALAARASSPWHDFWSTLKAGYASFERTRRPPRVSVCEGRYLVEDAPPKALDTAEVQESKRARGKSRSDMMLGAIRSGCPEPRVAAGSQANAAASNRMQTGAIKQR
jgi:murein L,D-transpeptidase YafK